MIVAFYTNADGVIFKHHKVPDDMNPLELQEKIAEYNKKSPDKVQVETIENGSLEAYLFELANRRVTLSKETVQEVLDAIWEARGLVEGLMDGL